MSEVESPLNTETQSLLSTITNEGAGSFNQQQEHYQEQQKADNYSEESSSDSTSTEPLEIPQVATQLSGMDSTLFQDLQSLNLSNSPTTHLDFDVPFNPISFLNTMHQKLKTSEAPVYSFSHDPATGHFYCQVAFYGKTYQNEIARPKKQQAKEEAANIAMKDLSSHMQDVTDPIREELARAHISVQRSNKYGKNNNQTIKRPYSGQQIISPHPLELIPKSVQWREKQASLASSNGQVKRFCVLLLEFCQMHKLGHPSYTTKDDGSGYYLFECSINDRVFTPQLSFWKKSDAKDHVSKIAFDCLYKEFVDKEQREIQHSFPSATPLLPPISVPPPNVPPPNVAPPNLPPPNVAPPNVPPPNATFPLVYPNVTDGNNFTYY